MVELDLNRKGYGYRADARVKNGQAKAHVETQMADGQWLWQQFCQRHFKLE